MDCSKITAGLVAASCTAAEIAGTGSAVTLLNYADIDKETSVVASNVIQSIVLSGAAVGFTFESLEDSHVGEVALAKGLWYNEFDHTLTLRVFVKTEAAKAFVNGIKNARIVPIVSNKATGTAGNTKYEAYGWDAGLKVTELTGTTEFADKVVYTIKLASSDNSKEQTLPKSVFITSLTVTESMLASLLNT